MYIYKLRVDIERDSDLLYQEQKITVQHTPGPSLSASVQQTHIRGSSEGEKRSLLKINEHFRPTDNKVYGADERLPLSIIKDTNGRSIYSSVFNASTNNKVEGSEQTSFEVIRSPCKPIKINKNSHNEEKCDFFTLSIQQNTLTIIETSFGSFFSEAFKKSFIHHQLSLFAHTNFLSNDTLVMLESMNIQKLRDIFLHETKEQSPDPIKITGNAPAALWEFLSADPSQKRSSDTTLFDYLNLLALAQKIKQENHTLSCPDCQEKLYILDSEYINIYTILQLLASEHATKNNHAPEVIFFIRIDTPEEAIFEQQLKSLFTLGLTNLYKNGRIVDLDLENETPSFEKSINVVIDTFRLSNYKVRLKECFQFTKTLTPLTGIGIVDQAQSKTYFFYRLEQSERLQTISTKQISKSLTALLKCFFCDGIISIDLRLLSQTAAHKEDTSKTGPPITLDSFLNLALSTLDLNVNEKKYLKKLQIEVSRFHLGSLIPYDAIQTFSNDIQIKLELIRLSLSIHRGTAFIVFFPSVFLDKRSSETLILFFHELTQQGITIILIDTPQTCLPPVFNTLPCLAAPRLKKNEAFSAPGSCCFVISEDDFQSNPRKHSATLIEYIQANSPDPGFILDFSDASPSSFQFSYFLGAALGIFQILRDLLLELQAAKIFGLTLKNLSLRPNRESLLCQYCNGSGFTHHEYTLLICPECHGIRFMWKAQTLRYKNLTFREIMLLPIKEITAVLQNIPSLRHTLELLKNFELDTLNLSFPVKALRIHELQLALLIKNCDKIRAGKCIIVLRSISKGMSNQALTELSQFFKKNLNNNTFILIDNNIYTNLKEDK
jgi:Zn finger protein HypA/HybF involved in hydrogenase expression